MTKKVRAIPIIGKNGLMAIIGCIVGVFAHCLGRKQVDTIPELTKSIYKHFIAWDVVSLAIPLTLLALIGKYRAFFIGWFVGILGFELVENVAYPEILG